MLNGEGFVVIRARTGTFSLGKLGLRLLVSGLGYCLCNHLQAQKPTDTLNEITHKASFSFLQRDGTCVQGVLAKADATSITVQPPQQKPEITVPRSSLVQIAQGDGLLFSVRSSWLDVMNTHIYPREALVLEMNGGKRVTGKPTKITQDAITLKHGFHTDVYPKTTVSNVAYLRVKPATDDFNFVLQEAPYAAFLYPEFYTELRGWLGGYLFGFTMFPCPKTTLWNLKAALN